MAHLSMQHIRSTPSALLPTCAQVRDPPSRHQPATTCSTKRADVQHCWRPKKCQVPWCKGLVAAGAALALAVSTAAAAEDLTISFKASRNPEIRKAQKSLVEAWGVYADQTCIDVRDLLSDLYVLLLHLQRKGQSHHNILLQLRLCGNTIHGTRI